MIIIPAKKREQFENALAPKTAFITSFLTTGHEISCQEANEIINRYQQMLEIIRDVKNGEKPNNSIVLEIDPTRTDAEHAYSLIDITTFSQILVALTAIEAFNIRFYFAKNSLNQTTLAIVGEDEKGGVLMPSVGGEYVVYENFTGNGIINSYEIDIPCP